MFIKKQNSVNLSSQVSVLINNFPYQLFPPLYQIVAKEREVSEWKEKYEESRREVMEMR